MIGLHQVDQPTCSNLSYRPYTLLHVEPVGITCARFSRKPGTTNVGDRIPILDLDQLRWQRALLAMGLPLSSPRLLVLLDLVSLNVCT